jgi:hypothetical protein
MADVVSLAAELAVASGVSGAIRVDRSGRERGLLRAERRVVLALAASSAPTRDRPERFGNRRGVSSESGSS